MPQKPQKPLALKPEHIWQHLRGPFRYPQAGHNCTWERFDADKAGCLLCGEIHTCSSCMADWNREIKNPKRCPLFATDDSAHVCSITGLCMTEVRTSTCEYIDHATFDRPVAHPVGEDEDGIYDRVQCVIANFLLSKSTAACRKMEHDKYIQKTRQAFWRILKQRKRDHPYKLPDMCSVIAEVVKAEPLPPFLPLPVLGRTPPDPRLMIKRSSNYIAACMMQINCMGFRKLCQGGKFQSIVIGMLYMTRVGLKVGKLFQLPSIPRIHELLPSETYLSCLGISNKVICDTENEIKSCIRMFTDSSASSLTPKPPLFLHGQNLQLCHHDGLTL